MRTYGVHVVLLVSLFINLVMFVTRPSFSRGVNPALKRSFEELARDVTNQLLDSSYISYEKNTTLLVSARELAPGVITAMQKSGYLPKNKEELLANVRSLTSEKMVISVRIDQVVQGEPDPQQGNCVPIDIGGVVAKHSASGADEQKFHLKFLMGLQATGQKEKDTSINSHSRVLAQQAQQVDVQIPIVATFQDLSGQPMPAAASGGPAY